MKIYPELIVCPQCNTLYRYHIDITGSTACCVRCHSVLWRNRSPDTAFMLPLTLSALITFSLACIYPVMVVNFNGISNDITLWQTAWVLADDEIFPLMAMLTAFLLIVAPLIQIVLLLWILVFAHFKRRAPGFVIMMKTLSWLWPWGMAEVGVLGFLVAAIKLSTLLEVAPGTGGWALVASVALMIIVTSRDLQSLWIFCPFGLQAEGEHA